MAITLSWQTIVSAAAGVTALGALAATAIKLLRWLDRQKEQDSEISDLKAEQALLVCGILACLKGLREQGCNGPVTEAIERIEKHINKKAHK